MTNNIDSIVKIKRLLEEIELSTEVSSLEKLVKNLNNMMDRKEIISRYAPFLEPKKKGHSNKRDELKKKGMFKVQLSNFKTIEDIDVIKYCDAHNILLVDYIKKANTYKEKSKLEKWMQQRFIESLNDYFDANLTIDDSRDDIFWIYKSFTKKIIELLPVFENKIIWSFLSKENNFNWDIEVLTKGKELWDWTEISRNPSIKWDFQLIHEFKDPLDWKYVNVFKDLYWTTDLLKKYSKYIFSVKVPEYDPQFRDYCISIQQEQ